MHSLLKSITLIIIFNSILFGQVEIPFTIPVVIIKYFPLNGENIDIKVTGDYGNTLDETREKTDSLSRMLVELLSNSSRYHGYKDLLAPPSLKYKIVHSFEFLESLPTKKYGDGKTPITDYYSIMNKIDVKKWVEEFGVKEFWIWGYHGGVIDLWESNMSSPFGDVSNSDRNEEDLPVFEKTYTVYHYNYQRGLSEAVEDHMHQIEAVLNNIDGRDSTDEDEWDKLLFWGKFVGSDISHKIINPGCGWAHYPPNGKKDYNWDNEDSVSTNIEDWHPDGSGERIVINCKRWNCNSLDWFVYWMQTLPGYKNQIPNEKKLNNWWIFIGEYDYAKKNKLTLIEN